MMVTAEKGIGVFQLDQKYLELPSVMRRDVGKSGNCLHTLIQGL